MSDTNPTLKRLLAVRITMYLSDRGLNLDNCSANELWDCMEDAIDGWAESYDIEIPETETNN